MADQKPVEDPAPASAPEKREELVSAAGTDNAAIKAGSATGSIVKEDALATETTAKDAAALESAPKPDESKSDEPSYLANNLALKKFFESLPGLVTSTGHAEMWGVPLKDSNDIPTVNVLIKFLRANEGNVQAAEDQLCKALEWRKEINPLALVESGQFSARKFAGLGYLTTYEDEGRLEVFTWNIYGAVKDVKLTFTDTDEFVKWRATLMELAVQELKMKDTTEVIPYDGEDPYQMVQVHDYLNVKFFSVDAVVRAATHKTIEVFATAYPELLREKFFVNVPAVMGWMYAAVKVFVSKKTTRKFHPISYGTNLAREFPAAVADKLPKAYGGKGPELDEAGRIVPLVEDAGKEDSK